MADPGIARRGMITLACPSLPQLEGLGKRCKLPLRARAKPDRQTLFIVHFEQDIASGCNSLPNMVQNGNLTTGGFFRGHKTCCCVPMGKHSPHPWPWVRH